MTSTTLDSTRSALELSNGSVCCQSHLLDFTGAAFSDGDTVEIAILPPRARIIDVKWARSDLDSGADMEVDVGLNPAPGVTSADADVLVDGLSGSAQTAGFSSMFEVAPTIASGEITAGVGLETHQELDSKVFLTMVDNGDATSGTIYTQVWYTLDDSFESVTATNS